MSEELKACPFCGKMPLVLDDGKRINLGCTNNKCFAPVRFTINNTLPDLEWKLIGLWNTRPLEDALIAERDKLQAKLDLDHATSFKIMEDYRIAEAELRRKLEAAKEALKIISQKTTSSITTNSESYTAMMSYFPTEEASIAKKALKQLEAE